MSSSPGKRSVSARKAGSRLSSSATRARPSIKGAASARPISTSLAKDRPASQRLNGSVSCASKNARSVATTCRFSTTGAEKPRKIEAVGRAARPVKSKDCSAWVSSSTVVGTTSSPLGFSNPTATGITFGSLSGCPGVGGLSWRSVRRKVPLFSNQSSVTDTRGVPAWPYQRLNWVRSRPVASSNTRSQSSIVAACPS